MRGRPLLCFHGQESTLFCQSQTFLKNQLLEDHFSIFRFMLKYNFIIYLFYIVDTDNFIYKVGQTLLLLTSTDYQTTLALR
jgi:hypothetical protein